MKSRTWTCITAITLFAALAIPVRLAAQEQQQGTEKVQHYTVTDLGTLGGTFSGAFGINNKAQLAGQSNLPGDTEFHAFLWSKGVMTDLGTLGGPNSTAFFPLNERGEVAGFSDTSTPDPLGEDFCGFGTHLVCLPFVWRDGVLTPLPTLGGSNGEAGTINNRGQASGVAENTTPDPTCPPPQVLQFKPVVWDKGEIQELPTFPGDTEGAAQTINDNGQAAGYSGTCTGAAQATHALLWQNGTATDLGNLGGTIFSFGAGINNQGQVVGASDLPGDTTYHAFLWQNGVITDLGTLPGDFGSQARDINGKSQVVGISFDASGNERGFLWQNGVMTDLNSLIPAGSPLFLIEAWGINSRGQIAGLALVTATGEIHAFLATPSNGEVASESATPATPGSTTERPKVVLPENVRRMLQQRLRLGRFGAAGTTSGPIVMLSPTSLTFATQLVGTTSPAQSVTLTNSGNTTLNITSITIRGADHGDFAQTNTCGSSVAAGASCTISVTFKPTQINTRTDTLSVTDNAPGSPQKVSLTGTGTVVELNPTSLNFGSEGLGGIIALTTTLTNVGSTTLSITSITITGSSEFSETNTCGNSVGAGKSCTITATFKPTVFGTVSGDVSISDNGGGSPQQVPLSGTGVVCGGVCPTNGCPTGCRCEGLDPPLCLPNFLTSELLLDPNSAASAPCGK